MKHTLRIALMLCMLPTFHSCTQPTPEEAKEEKEVDSMIQTDEQRADSMKKALGLE